MSVFYDHIMKESREISKILDVEVPMLPLTLEQVKDYDEAGHFANCKEPFSVIKDDIKGKVHHHCHVTFVAFD